MSIGIGCGGVTSGQLSSNQEYAGQITVTAPGINGTVTGTLKITLQVGTLAPAVVTLNFTNKLLYPVNVLANGTAIGVVDASGTMSKTVPSSSSLSVSFEMLRPSVGSLPLGDPMTGVYDTILTPSGSYNFLINNKIGSQSYFIPLINNQSSTAALIDVNGGLSSDSKCFCESPALTNNIAFGYHLLVSGSNVRAYRLASNYIGNYIFWGYDSVFGPSTSLPSVDADTGILHLLFSTAP